MVRTRVLIHKLNKITTNNAPKSLPTKNLASSNFEVFATRTWSVCKSGDDKNLINPSG